MLKLPPRMEEVLLLVYGRGSREVDVAEKLGISKQAVSKALREARGRLAQIFLAVADLMGADIVRVNIEKGYAIVKIRQTRQKAYIFYIPGKGPKVIFEGSMRLSRDDEKLYEEVIKAAMEWGVLKGKVLEVGDLVRAMKELIKVLER